MRKFYRIFISHSWSYEKNQQQVIELIERNGLILFDHSVQDIDLAHTTQTEKELHDAIEHHMKGTSCLLILSSFYSPFKDRIDKEIEIAQRHNKSIISVEPQGYKKTPQVIKESSDRIVKLQGKSIVEAIRQVG